MLFYNLRININIFHFVIILAADHGRVILTAIDDKEVTTYINAVFVDVSKYEFLSIIISILLQLLYINTTSTLLYSSFLYPHSSFLYSIIPFFTLFFLSLLYSSFLYSSLLSFTLQSLAFYTNHNYL